MSRSEIDRLVSVNLDEVVPEQRFNFVSLFAMLWGVV
jgi:hypothetical protein